MANASIGYFVIFHLKDAVLGITQSTRISGTNSLKSQRTQLSRQPFTILLWVFSSLISLQN